MVDKKIAVIITAGGNGSRMGAGINKLFLDVDNKPILARTISKFYDLDYIDEIVVALNLDDYELFEKKIKEPYGFDKVRIVSGGKDRQESSYNALKALDKDTDFVLIHDGARPFVSENVIKDCLDKTLEYGAAIASIPAEDTIKYSSDQTLIDFTPPRNKLFHAQTPQGFSYNLILKANQERNKELSYPVTDDASMIEQSDKKVALSKGEKANIKITTPDDLIYAEALARIY